MAATPNYMLSFIDGTLVVAARPDFGASASKYIPPVSGLGLLQSGPTPCSSSYVASALQNSGSAVIFGPQAWGCGSL